ncbi:MAG: UDP-N-acetylmuramoyl-L-alanine--D-glutamate ligase, partial [Alphaproteobacteria bacterium]|nr:UDP-N-acetylmuramoyl-L-alanine--D-glutamate ligase [Alphaproteobacteria bacterium]
ALDLPPLDADGIHVLELSSYQLELMTTPVYDHAVILNISPDHLDRHGGIAGYVAAKARLLDLLRAPATLVIGIDDPHCRDLGVRARRLGTARLLPVSGVEPAPGGVYALDGRLIDDIDGAARTVFDLAEAPALPGAHNGQNAAAAYAVARGLDVDPATIAAALRSFPGLPHRQERVATIAGIAYVNDSKATNLTATARALASYAAVYWIAGGRAKGDDPAAIAPYFDRIRHAFLIGEAAPAFGRALDGHVPATECGTLAAALAKAHALAQKEGRPGDVVLLSPGCASFDQWRDFEERGDAFRAAVKAMAEAGAAVG